MLLELMEIISKYSLVPIVQVMCARWKL